MDRGRPIVAALLVALTAMLALAGTSAGEAHIIQLKHRPAGEIIPLIRPLLGPEDALSGMDYRLIVRTSDKSLKEIERLLAQLDVAQRQLRITVEQRVADDRDTTTHSVEGEVRIGDKASIKLPEKTPDNRGLVVQKDDVRLRANQRTMAGRNETAQTVMVLDGQRASIRIGQSVPYVKEILALARGQVLIAQDIELEDVTTGFDVLPRVRGNRVLMEITPRLSTLRKPASGLADFDADHSRSAPCGRAARVQIRSGQICQDFQELTTAVEVKLGEWIDLGTILGQRNEIDRAILESAATESGERRTIRLKIEESLSGARLP
jgi:Bacterial type II and III secretion system protein